MVGEIADGSADLVVAALSLSLERAKVIDLTTVLHTTDFGLLIKRPQTNHIPNIWAYLAIFTLQAWLFIFLQIFVLSICYFLQKRLISNNVGLEEMELSNCFALVLLAMILQDYSLESRRWSTRTLQLSTWIFAYLTFAFYAADLTSRLTVTPAPESFSSLDEAIDQGYKLIILESTAMETVFRSAKVGSSRHKIWKEVIEPNPELLVKNRIAGLKLLIGGDKYAYISAYSVDPRYINKSCFLLV